MGLGEIYAQVLELAKMQTILVTKMEALIETWETRSDGLNRDVKQLRTDYIRDFKDLDHRVQTIEKAPQPFVTTKAMWTAIGMVVPASSLVVSLLALILK